ncbi:MAG: hypothetical protein ACOX12_10025 [Eggerthellaceae bacterium]
MPSGCGTPSSSKMKCGLPMRTSRPSTVEAMPCDTMYSTCECSSSGWCRSRVSALRTMARAMLCGKCSSMQAAARSSSSSE